ncbi:hypothetical protein psyc5s11_52710 [Clostridium gelidum]|uniref:Lipoprotein n=1 Tax=Clostridium gelidum TaxID=704125 RepID=A0ABM7TD75_9CLOT|nr:hypothetical protein [Clostridium gelidum]BCZ49204.1 hypothetical protein psyc5s11_52710 [Clostridium gelidum]
MRKKYVIIILIVFTLCIIGYIKSSSNLKNYLNSGTLIDSNAKDIMPSLDDLPEYQNITYKYTHKSMFFFESHSVALIVKYEDETYKREKDKLAEKYTFLNKKVNFRSDESIYLIPEYEFSVNSYNFKVVDRSEKSNTQFPKSFGMIGISEEKKSIAYLYFYDKDLDFIGGENDKAPMANFVKDYFKYDF